MFPYGPWLAHDGNDLLANAQGEMYAVGPNNEVSTTVLQAYDMESQPVPFLVSGVNGMLPKFQLDEGMAWWVSGAHQILVVSWPYLYDTVLGAKTDAANSAAAAEAAQLAAEQAENQLPPGGEIGYVLTKQSGADRDVAWAAATGGTDGGAPATHSHSVSDLRKTDTTTALATIVLNVLLANDAPTIRQIIGAGTGNGTSNLVIGTTAGTAADATHTHPYYTTETRVQEMIDASGVGNPSNTVSVVRQSGAYPVQPASYPDGTVRIAYGSVPPTYGATPGVILDKYVPTDGI